MSLTLRIGNADLTNRLTEGSLVIRTYGAHRSSFAATLTVSAGDTIPAVGQELRVWKENDLFWGGILIEINTVCYSPESAEIQLRGQGYEQILQRYCVPALDYPDYAPTSVAEDLIESFVGLTEPIDIGNIESGYGAHEYHFYPSKVSALMDYLANECGFFWWISKDKEFFMRRTLSEPSAERIVIDLTGQDQNRLEDLQTFSFRASTAGYRNTQYAYNKSNYAYGIAYNTPEVGRMSNRFGGGEYGAVCSSYVIESRADGDQVASQVLNEYPGTDEVRFSTDDGRFSLGQSVGVIAPICGINTEKPFSVTEIRAVWFHDRFRYTVTAKELLGTGAGIRASWERILAQSNPTERED